MSRANWLLFAGAFLGIGVAALGILDRPVERVPADAVALVNGHAIRRDDYVTALAAVASDRRSGGDEPAMRQHVLDRLIDEELLVQAALDLGLAQRDRRVRADLSSAAIAFSTESPDEREPSESELRELHAEHAGYFAQAAEVEVEQMFFAVRGADDDAATRARADAARAELLRGGPALGDAPPLALPKGALSPSKLEQYLGPTAARVAAELPVGGVSEPVRAAQGYRVLRVVSRSGGAPRAFEDVRESVRAEWQRRASEQRLRTFLNERRKSASVTLSQELGS